MPETNRIADQLHRAFEGSAWHGPSLYEALAGVDAATAAARPIRDAHTIWELTLHVATWEDVVRRRMDGKAVMPTDEENFPKVSDTSESAWENTKQLLRNRHEELLSAVLRMSEARLTEQVPGKDYDYYHLLHGEAQHAIYHAGQIVLLKKART